MPSAAEEERLASGAAASTSDDRSPAVAAESAPAAAAAPAKKAKKTYSQLEMPSPQMIIQQDIMDNCFVKSALSGAMGGVAGLAFGLFSASFENAHGVRGVAWRACG